MPMRFLTNDFKDCRLIKLDPSEAHSPFVVEQEGVGPNDPACKTRMYYLQHDGKWIDEVARSTRPDSEIGDIVFESPAEAVELLSSLFGKPHVRELPVTEADVDAYIARAQSAGSAEAAFREFLARYRGAKKRK
ncbi:hypothetical protein [Chthoniobacter flavus]|nr:hypothetical protein [Chthoniobacter flavus]